MINLRGVFPTLMVLLSLAAMPGEAAVYTYTGNNFTFVGAPTTTEDSVMATLTLDAPLPANLGIPAFIFSNLGNLPGFHLTMTAGDLTLDSDSALAFMLGVTDGDGMLVNWNVFMLGETEPAGSLGWISTVRGCFESVVIGCGINPLQASIYDLTDIVGPDGAIQSFGAVYFAAGEWTIPLPAAAWLFGSALLGLGVIKRKRA